MRLLARVHQEVLLQVSQLGEALVAGLTLEGSLPTVDAKVDLRVGQERSGWCGTAWAPRHARARRRPHLQVGQLSKGLAADVALVFDLAVLLLQRVRQCLVAHRAHARLRLAQVDGLRVRPVLAGVAQEG